MSPVKAGDSEASYDRVTEAFVLVLFPAQFYAGCSLAHPWSYLFTREFLIVSVQIRKDRLCLVHFFVSRAWRALSDLPETILQHGTLLKVWKSENILFRFRAFLDGRRSTKDGTQRSAYTFPWSACRVLASFARVLKALAAFAAPIAFFQLLTLVELSRDSLRGAGNELRHFSI